MLIFATAESRNVTNLKIKRALETAEFIYVYISESKLGEGCLQKRQERAFDAVTANRIEKPVKFFIETEAGAGSGFLDQAYRDAGATVVYSADEVIGR